MQYGLIGEKLGHSFSKEVHSLLGDYKYEPNEVAPADFKDFMLCKNFKGINVTIPYKKDIIPFLDEVDKTALEIGAINTVVNREGKLYGYNTDFLGMQAMLKYIELDLKGKKVVILGNGGTSKTARYVAKAMGASSVIIVSRSGQEGTISYQEVTSCHADAQVIINTTPVGMHPNTLDSPIDLSAFNHLEGVVDVIYNPLKTKLIEQAENLRIKKCTNGIFMLVGQAVYAYGKFFDTNVELEKIVSICKTILKRKQNVVLIGMPTCGKTTVGKELASMLNREHVDVDSLIEQQTLKSIPEIFASLGEKGFRQLEKQQVEKVSKLNGCVISTGGGVVLDEENLKMLKQNGKIVFIDRDLKNLIAEQNRPLSNKPDQLKELYNKRYPLYKKGADVIVDGNNCVKKVAEDIIKEL